MKHPIKCWFGTGPSAIFIAFWLLTTGFACWLNEMILFAVPNFLLGLGLVCYGLTKIYKESNEYD